MPKIIATIGRPAVHAPDYVERDWSERDNFATLATARAYAGTMSRMHPATPYRIIQRRSRFVVQFVPAWKLAA